MARTTDEYKQAIIQARLPQELADEFKNILDDNQQSASAVVRSWVRDFVASHHQQGKQGHSKPAFKLK
jgi:metal-responsive CopG/Arc/MetJ family transcriptional regulator